MDDDIFSDPKETKDVKEDSNMDWKKSGIDKHERLTLKVSVKEANMYSANKKRDTKPKFKARTPLDVPQGFKKIRKKIKDSYDDEDEDDAEYILVPVFMDKEVSSLELALTPQEKKQLEQMEKQQPEEINIRQSVNRDIQLQRAEKVLKNAGLEADRKITEQKRTRVEDVKSKDLAEDNLKKRKKQKEKAITKNKEEKPIKPAKELPKIKDAETKEVRKAIIDDAEKEKKSTKNELEKQLQKKEEINAVTKEKTKKQKTENPEKQKEKEKEQETAAEIIQQKEKQEKIIQKEEEKIKQPLPPEQQQENPQPEKRELDEKTARQIILEKSGRTTNSSDYLDAEIFEQQAEIEKTEKEIEEEKTKQRQTQFIINRSGRGR